MRVKEAKERLPGQTLFIPERWFKAPAVLRNRKSNVVSGQHQKYAIDIGKMIIEDAVPSYQFC